jgi:hypothetical protein
LSWRENRCVFVVERCETGQGRGFLAAEAAKLGHADDERQRGAFADTGDTQHHSSDIVFHRHSVGRRLHQLHHDHPSDPDAERSSAHCIPDLNSGA